MTRNVVNNCGEPTNGQPCHCCVTESTSLSQPRSELDSRIRNIPRRNLRDADIFCMPSEKVGHIYSREYRVHVLGVGAIIYGSAI